MEDCLPHGDELLKKIFLEGAGPHSSPCAKAMQSVMELYEDYIRRFMMLDIAFHRTSTITIPLKLVPPPLGYHHHRLPGAQRCEFSSPEVCLYGVDDLLLVPREGVFLLLCHAKPQHKVFGPHF